MKKSEVMQKFLLVIDVQTDYVGAHKEFKDPKLLSKINQRIKLYPADHVLYVVNRFLWESKREPKKLAAGLDVVSEFLFEKRHGSCLTNKDLQAFLQQHQANQLEFVGVDGNYCVNASVMAGLEAGYSVSVNLECIGAEKQAKFAQTIKQWQKAGCLIK